MISNFPRYTVKAGRFVYDLATKKVKVSKDKGNLNLFTVLHIISRIKSTKIILVGSTLIRMLKKLISSSFLSMLPFKK